jgi:hypothetical protein
MFIVKLNICGNARIFGGPIDYIQYFSYIAVEVADYNPIYPLGDTRAPKVSFSDDCPLV